MNIILFGNDLFSARALQGVIAAGHNVSAVIIDATGPYRAAEPLIQTAEKNAVPVYFDPNPNGAFVSDLLSKREPDLILCVHLRKILRKEIYGQAAHGAVNVHPSLLPKYRGLSPFEQTILHGDKEAGISIHFIDEGMDTGDVILQQRLPLPPDCNLFQLQLMLLPQYESLVPEAIKRLASATFRAVPQSGTAVSSFGIITRKDREIFAGLAIAEIDRRVRAFTKPGRGALYDNRLVWTARFATPEEGKSLMQTGFSNGKQLILRGRDGVMISEDFEPNDAGYGKN